MNGDSVDVTTSIYNDSDAAEPARAICNAVRFSGLGIEYARVTDSSGDSIVQGSNATCD